MRYRETVSSGTLGGGWKWGETGLGPVGRQTSQGAVKNTTGAATATVLSTQQQCWVCGSADSAKWKPNSLDRPLEPSDFQITDSRYGVTLTLFRCEACGFIFADEKEAADLVSLYERLEDNEYEKGLENRSLQMRRIANEMRKAHPAGRTLLDIGAGIGLMVNESRKAGFDAIGIEPSRALVAAGKRLLGVDLLQGIFPHPAVAGRRFDVISLVDVIEHVRHPVELLRECGKALQNDGVLTVVTPDVGSAAARLMGRRWWHLRLAHVGYFDHRSMAIAAQKAGLEVMSTTRAVWSFPVSYLAERLAVYLPIGAANRWAAGTQLLGPVYRSVIHLNLHDSTVFFLRRAGA